MNCDEVMHLAPLHLSAELDGERALAFQQHLNACIQCSRSVFHQREFDRYVRAEMLRERVDTSVVEQKVQRAIAAESRRKFALVAAIAAIVLFTFAGYRALIESRSKAIYSAAARDHHREIIDAQPRKWQTDAAAITQLVSRQGIEASDIEELAPAGYHLSQGRLCFLSGQIFVHLVYANADRRFSVFLRRKDTRLDNNSAYSFTAEHVACVQKNDLTAVLVSNESDDAVLGLARSIKSEM